MEKTKQNKTKYGPYPGVKKQSIETIPEVSQTWELREKDFESAILIFF